MKFLNVDSVEIAREKLLGCTEGRMMKSEVLPLGEALGRVLARDVFSSEDIPGFRRSTVDGYAVVSGDTAAAGESIPVFLTVRGHVEMGKPATFAIKVGECAAIPTGGMLPEGADAVAMVEYSEPFGDDGIALYNAVAHGENVIQTGEDMTKGDLILQKGRLLLPQDVGALAASGVTAVPVYIPPKVTVISTGDELIAPSDKPQPGQVRDVNTCSLSALAEKCGYAVVGTDVLPDDKAALENAIRRAMGNSDIVLVSGGSSQGEKDMTREIIDKVSNPGVYTHGLAVKPGKPTILGYDEASQTVVAGLPGHPVSAMIIFELLFGWLLLQLTESPGQPAIPAKLSVNVASSPGKLNCWPVKLSWASDGYVAEPVFGKSGLISTLTRADGFFIIDRDAEGKAADQIVLVHMF